MCKPGRLKYFRCRPIDTNLFPLSRIIFVEGRGGGGRRSTCVDCEYIFYGSSSPLDVIRDRPRRFHTGDGIASDRITNNFRSFPARTRRESTFTWNILRSGIFYSVCVRACSAFRSVRVIIADYTPMLGSLPPAKIYGADTARICACERRHSLSAVVGRGAWHN